MTVPRAAGTPGRASGAAAPRVRGLDGLRALAVIAVVCYHARFQAAGGGYLGVEVFFVLSGYLITGLIVEERSSTGCLCLGRFWWRRAKRLLPALYVMLGITILTWRLAYPGDLAADRGDAVAGLGYVTNWWLIIRHQSYFQAFGHPSPFTHLWSLAIEEQFYLLWPLLLVALRAARRWQLAGLALIGAAGSLFLMAHAYHPGLDASRAYVGSDTRASGLLTGAAAALLCWQRRGGVDGHDARASRAATPRVLAGISWLAMAGLVVALARLPETSPILYRGGLGLVDLAAVALVVTVARQPRGRLTGLLETRTLRWLGVRSYGIYLWHWPVFAFDRSTSGAAALVVRLGLTLATAEASYRFIEVPVRAGALGQAWRALRSVAGRWRRLAPITLVATALAGGSATAVAAASAAPLPVPAYLTRLAPVDLAPAAAGRPAIEVGSHRPAPTRSTRWHHSPGRPDRRSACYVSAFGDSVLLGALPALRVAIPELRTIDARIGLQIPDAIGLIADRAKARQLGCVVIVHLGNNGLFTAALFGRLMTYVGPYRIVLIVNDHVPAPWQGPNNAFLAAVVRRQPNTILVNWFGYSSRQRGIFYPDQTHLDPSGQVLYARLIETALKDAYLARLPGHLR